MANPKRGEFTIEFAGKPTTFRMRANECAVFEERLRPDTLRDFLINRSTGPRTAREIVYAGLMHKNTRQWNPIEAGRLLDKHLEGGGSITDVIAPTHTIILDTMPEFRDFLKSLSDDEEPKEPPKEGAEDPTGAPTGESIGTDSSNGR